MILIVDDDHRVADVHADLVRRLGYEAVVVTDPYEVEEVVLANPGIRLALLDLKIPGKDGLEILARLRTLKPQIGVIMATVVNDIEKAVRAIKKGAWNYLLKPLREESLGRVIASCLDHHPTVNPGDEKYAGIISDDIQIRKVLSRLEAFASADVTVLIEGESGTGKELFAQMLHAVSPRRTQPFMAVNVAALSEKLFESELFGHVKGAYTGAVSDRVGYLEAAKDGTLFLDEIGELPATLQTKLLRVLQEKKFVRLGETVERPLRARLVAATNQNLKSAVAEGRFREDLYYRVAGHSLELPPLRDRPKDIELLVNHFFRKYVTQYGRDLTGVDDDVVELLRQYEFPGNVRELEGIVSSAVLIEVSSQLTSASLPEHVRGGPPGLTGLELDRYRQVMRALAEFDGNKTRAAEQLGVSRQTLIRWLKSYSAGPA